MMVRPIVSRNIKLLVRGWNLRYKKLHKQVRSLHSQLGKKWCFAKVSKLRMGQKLREVV